MEHKLITGGFQYLPYARSRIKAMRAAGLTHAAEPLLFPDASGSVRIVGEHSFIRLAGGGQQITMDSGVVDLTTGFAGKRRDTFTTSAYLAEYTLGSALGAWVDWRSKPGGPLAGQLIGTVSFTPLAGHVRDDLTRAPSFEPLRQAVEPATDPPTWVYAATDDALTAKRNTATTTGCPPSIFTGRTRLYVQAMYGRPLHRYGGDASVTPIDETVGMPSLQAGAGAPTLLLPSYKAPGDEATYPPVTLSTSSGVRFDPVTGQHWLMNVNGGHLDVYPLKSNSVGELLRRHALTPALALSGSDREKAEAYVLAYSLPDVANKISVALGTEVGAYAMGYGWHWNWSGTAADIVFLTGYYQGGGNYAMESTHRRITVAWGDTPTASVYTVEGPSRWAVPRLWWCITEPGWGTGAAIKTTPRNSETFACDAPFYCFYKRDELQVARVTVSDVDAQAQTREVTDYFASSSAYGGPVEGGTTGLLTGYCEDRQPTLAHIAGTFSCGGLSTPSLILGNEVTGSRWEVTDKSVVTEPVAASTEPVWSGVYTIYHGYGPPITAAYERLDIASPKAIAVSNDSPPVVRFTWRTYNFVRTEVSLAEIVVPFYDSEAIFIRGRNVFTTVKNSERVRVFDSPAFGSAMSWYQYYSDGFTLQLGPRNGPYIAWIQSNASGGVVSDVYPPTATTVDESGVSSLVSKAGPTDADLGLMASYHQNDVETAESFGVLSSAAVPGTVVLAGDTIAPVGISQNYPSPTVMVGWI